MDNTQARILGDLIRNARQDQGWSLDTLAQNSGIPPTWLFSLEEGRYRQPAPNRLAQLAEVLQIDPVVIDAISRDHLANSLPSVRTYFRSKEKATPAQIAEIEEAIEQILSKQQGGEKDGRESRRNKGST